MESKDESKDAPNDKASYPSRVTSNGSNSISTTESQSVDDDPKKPEESIEPECKSQEATFPQQLMDVIETETTSGTTTSSGEKVLEWLPNGDAFIIRDKALLEKEVLPKHFSAKCKFMSFVRKLYRWGFRQVEKNVPGITIFMHTNFVRGDKKRCLMMRSIVKNSAAASSAQASLGPLLGANGLNAGVFMNQNLPEGLLRSMMGFTGQVPQFNQLLFPQAQGAMNVQGIFPLNQQQPPHQQQVVNNFPGLLNSGNPSNANAFAGANLAAMSMNAHSNPTGAPQQFNITDLLNNNRNAMNANSFAGGAALPSSISVTSNLGVTEATNQVNIPNIMSTGQGSNSNPLPGNSNYNSSETTTSSSSPSAAAAPNANPQALHSESPSPVVLLAMQIMQNNPSIEPKAALELARKIRGEV